MVLGVIFVIGKDVEEGHGVDVIGDPRRPGQLVVALGAGGHEDFRFLVDNIDVDAEVFFPHGLQGFGYSLVHFIGIEEERHFRQRVLVIVTGVPSRSWRALARVFGDEVPPFLTEITACGLVLQSRRDPGVGRFLFTADDVLHQSLALDGQGKGLADADASKASSGR